jgi:hypothetical protein
VVLGSFEREVAELVPYRGGFRQRQCSQTLRNRPMGRNGNATGLQQENEGTVGAARTIEQQGEAAPWSKEGKQP